MRKLLYIVLILSISSWLRGRPPDVLFEYVNTSNGEDSELVIYELLGTGVLTKEQWRVLKARFKDKKRSQVAVWLDEDRELESLQIFEIRNNKVCCADPEGVLRLIDRKLFRNYMKTNCEVDWDSMPVLK